MLTPDYDASLKFLEKLYPDGPWVLTSIDPAKTAIETRTFWLSTILDCQKWLERNGATRNIYYSIGRVAYEVSKKAEREDIQAVHYLHVDLDPRAGEDASDEQDRILKLLTTSGKFLPPTAVVFSGGGYNAIWKLKQPIEIGRDLAAAEEAARYNMSIELLFGADHCHNVDRILRLPGTINRPDAGKRKKGRVDALAELTFWDDSREYDISQFQKAPKVQSGTATGIPTRGIVVSGNIPRFATADDFPEKVQPKTKVIIVQGRDPDEPNKHPSRSEWLFRVCCDLVRADCTNEEIFSIITDATYGISSSVLDKGSKYEQYALHNIEKAREEAIDKDLRTMNEKFAVISTMGGKCRIVEEVWDPVMKRHKLSKQGFDDFRNRYLNVVKECGVGPKGEPVQRPLGHWWISHPKRRQFETLVFAPGREVPGAYNLWRGFSCDPKPGDCGLYLGHLKNVLCKGDDELYQYLLSWMARTVQVPDEPGYSAVVLRGGMGTGKSIAVKIFGSLFGRHFLQVSDAKHVTGAFNAHLRDCVVLFGEEAFYAGDKRHESTLKTLITEEMIAVEPKGVDTEMGANCLHIMMASNENWVVPASVEDRRFFVLDVDDSHKKDHPYFAALQKQVDTGGREALLHFLLGRDIANFQVRDVPKTAALQEQKVHSFNVEEEWWFTKLRMGRILEPHPGWVTDICTVDLTMDFLNYTKGFGANRRGNATKLEISLRRFCSDLPPVFQKDTPIEVVMMDGSKRILNRPFFYRVPSLAQARKVWDEKFGGPYEWTDPKQPEVQAHLNGHVAASENPF